MELNQKVADFTLQTDEDKTASLSDYAGKPVVLFFYPRADTPGCTIEACGFRDTFKKLQAAGAVVLGISRDTPKAQAKFRAKYDLPYTLLADVDEKVCNQFGVMKEKNMYGKKVWGIERTTFVIGPDQTLLHIFPKVTPEGHAEQVLALIKEWKKTREQHNGLCVVDEGSALQVWDDGFVAGRVLTTARIGINPANPALEWPLRFALAGHLCVSGPKRMRG
jgi:peroxiredoxin Q/BCP